MSPYLGISLDQRDQGVYESRGYAGHYYDIFAFAQKYAHMPMCMHAPYFG